MPQQLKHAARKYECPLAFAMAFQAPQTRPSRGASAARELIRLWYKVNAAGK